MPESERWVALVGGYNAGQSGSSIVDEISVFDYLTAEGHRFDTVFVTTMINDFIWYRRLGTLNPEGYKARQTAYYERTDPTPWWAKISRIGAKLYQLGQTNSVTHRHIDQKSQMEFGRHVVGLADCPNTANLIAPWTVEETSAMRRLNTAVTATGARLVAMTETTGFSAPASSFAVDMRETFLCGSDGMLSMADTALVFERVQQAYLEAARTAGIDSFDLKTQMAAYSDGADGGYYTYDGVHLTPPGSHQVAQFVNDYLKTVE